MAEKKKVSNSEIAYRAQYQKEHYDRVTVFPEIGAKESWKEAAKFKGISLTQFVSDCVEREIARMKGKVPGASADDESMDYWPNAITESGERLFTTDSTSKDKCFRQFEIWENSYNYVLSEAWIERDGKKIPCRKQWAEG